MSFRRHGELQDGPDADRVGGWNDSGVSSLLDVTFDLSFGLTLEEVVWHELAHNFDEPGETDFVDQFRSVGGWSESPGVGLVQSTDEDWFHNTVDGDDLDGFAREYGKTNPFEDWATSFTAAVAIYEQVDYSDQDYEEVASRIAPRLAVLDAFFASF